MKKSILPAILLAALALALGQSAVVVVDAPVKPTISSTKPTVKLKPPEPSTEKLYGAPYVIEVTPTSAVLNWVLRVPATENTAAGWKVIRSKAAGLKPGTTYYYDVLHDGSAEGTGQFATAPEGRADFAFGVYGDTRTRPDIHRQVCEKMAQQSPAFVVHTGDLVADGTKNDLWPSFFESGMSLLRETALFPALGNHDRNSHFYYELFERPVSYYSFDWGKVHVAVLNSDVNNVSTSKEEREKFWNEELTWLEHDLAAASSADFRFVAFHHPPYTAMKGRQPGAQAIAVRVTPLLRKYQVQAVFSGHDHNYQRHTVAGIQYIVTGGGGAPLYEMDAPIPGITMKTEKIENFVLGRVSGRECLIQAYALDGRLIDSVSLASTPEKQ